MVDATQILADEIVPIGDGEFAPTWGIFCDYVCKTSHHGVRPVASDPSWQRAFHVFQIGWAAGLDRVNDYINKHKK